MEFRNTVQAARELNVKPQTLQRLAWDGTIPAPRKYGRSYVWSDENINQARQAITNRQIKTVETASVNHG